MSWNDWKTKPIASAAAAGARVLVERGEVGAVETHACPGSAGRARRAGRGAWSSRCPTGRRSARKPPGSRSNVISLSTVSSTPARDVGPGQRLAAQHGHGAVPPVGSGTLSANGAALAWLALLVGSRSARAAAARRRAPRLAAGASPTAAPAAAAPRPPVVLCRRHEPHRRPRPRPVGGVPGPPPAEARHGRPALPGGERRGERRDLGRRAAAHGVAAATAGGGAARRDRGERRPAGPGPRLHAREHPGDPRPRRAGSRRRRGRPRRDGGAAELRRGVLAAGSAPSTPSSPGRTASTLVPFLLEGVAAEASLNQADGIHPTAEGQRLVADNVWKALRPLL